MSEHLEFFRCANCRQYFIKKVPSQICCSEKCNSIYDAKIHPKPHEPTKAERILERLGDMW